MNQENPAQAQHSIDPESTVLPPAPSRLGLSHIDDLLSPDQQATLRQDLIEMAQQRTRSAGKLATDRTQLGDL